MDLVHSVLQQIVQTEHQQHFGGSILGELKSFSFRLLSVVRTKFAGVVSILQLSDQLFHSQESFEFRITSHQIVISARFEGEAEFSSVPKKTKLGPHRKPSLWLPIDVSLLGFPLVARPWALSIQGLSIGRRLERG